MTDVVQPGDTLAVGSGATVDGTLVLWSGTLEIHAGGTANGTVVNGGGVLVVDAGGTAVDSFLGGLAVENVFGTDINATIAGGAVMRGETADLPAHAPVLQHEAGAAGLADLIAQIIRLVAGVRADAHLVERARATAAHHRAQQARITLADHGAQLRDGPGIHRQRLVAVEAGRELHAPDLCGGELHMCGCRTGSG